MKKIILVPIAFWLAACEFHAGGIPYDPAPDGGDDAADAGDDAGIDADVTDAAPAPDATVCMADQVLTVDGCQPRPTITCSLSGSTDIRLRFEGYLSEGFLGAAPSGALSTRNKKFGFTRTARKAISMPLSKLPSARAAVYDGMMVARSASLTGRR